MEAVIFDLDGTLANVEHRRDLLPDWDSFFGAMDRDTPNQPIVDLYTMIDEFPDAPALFICTGRPEKYREVTERWLDENGLTCREAGLVTTTLMRPDGDYRSDVDVKRDMLNHIRGQGYDVLFTVDDRKSVVDMWRAEGITCLQCAPGFDEVEEPIVSLIGPPILSIMVGPSGAGKSWWIEDYQRYAGYEHELKVVSSDDIRDHLCENFKDQSRNDDVFRVFHRLIRTYLECGYSVVADATHVRTKDRLATRECATADTTVQYVVVDRPLEDKVRDGDWRNDVVLKGEHTLIQRHHDIMQSNLRAILSGDGDPSVVILDERH